jgi:hypothetical protein
MSLLPRFQENIGFSVSGNFKDFSSAGFDVQASWETGNEYECVGETGDEVCIWYKIAHTACTYSPSFQLYLVVFLVC